METPPEKVSVLSPLLKTLIFIALFCAFFAFASVAFGSNADFDGSQIVSKHRDALAGGSTYNMISSASYGNVLIIGTTANNTGNILCDGVDIGNPVAGWTEQILGPCNGDVDWQITGGSQYWLTINFVDLDTYSELAPGATDVSGLEDILITIGFSIMLGLFLYSAYFAHHLLRRNE